MSKAAAAMQRFKGFEAGSQRAVRIPEQFFNELLPEIDNLDELKLALAVIYLSLEKGEESAYFTLADLENDGLIRLMQVRSANQEPLGDTLGRLLRRGLVIEVSGPDEPELRFALNSPRGRKLRQQGAVASSVEEGRGGSGTAPTYRQSIFSLYEAAIGTVSPLIADDLRQAEKLYPGDWVEEAFKLAVRYNKRSWRYVQTILERWARDGRSEQTGR